MELLENKKKIINKKLHLDSIPLHLHKMVSTGVLNQSMKMKRRPKQSRSRVLSEYFLFKFLLVDQPSMKRRQNKIKNNINIQIAT